MLCQYRPTSIQQESQQSFKELNKVVGFKWLDSDKNLVLPLPAARPPVGQASPNNAQQPQKHASYAISQGKHFGPYHPLQGKYACVAVRRRGTINLFAQVGSDSRYYEVSSPLEYMENDFSTNNELVSHASWKGCRDNSLFVTTYNSSTSLLKVYRVVIDWYNNSQNKQSSTTNGYSSRVNSSSEFASIAVRRVLRSNMVQPSYESPQFLSDIYMIPTPPQKYAASNSSGQQPDTEICAVYSSPNNSIVQTYKVTSKSIGLHNSFYALSPRRGSNTGDEGEHELILQESRNVEAPIVSMGTACQDSFMYFCRADGAIDLKRLYSASNTTLTQILTLQDCGYFFPALPEKLSNVCLSPNLTSYVYFSSEDAEELLKINYLKSPLDYRDDESLIQSSVGLAIRHSTSCFANTFSDDLLCVMKTELEKAKAQDTGAARKFLQILIHECHRSINFTLDPPKDYQIDKIMVNPSLQKLLSMQHVLGSEENWKSDPMGRISWCMINLRLLAFALTFSLRIVSQTKTPTPNASSHISESDIKAFSIQNMMGLIRWCADFLVFVCQELYKASLDPDFYAVKRKHTNSTVTNSVVMSILLGRVPRMLLIYSLRGIRGLEQVAGRLAEQENNPLNGCVRAAYRRLSETTTMSPIKLSSFERMVTDIDNGMKNFYQTIPDPARLELEQELILKSNVPQSLMSIVSRTIAAFQKNLIPEINVPRLYFYDVSWLNLDGPELLYDEEVGENMNNSNDSQLASDDENTKIDVLRKNVISLSESVSNGRLRRCVRCGGYSLWDDPKSTPFTQWTLAFSRNCVCGGTWYGVIQ